MCITKISVFFTLFVSVSCLAIPPAYREVANAYDIPPDILYAIAFTESGYQFQSIYNPWPWTLNIEGKGYRFNNRESMLVKLQEAANKNQSVDIGVMQVNWRWHKHRFDSLRLASDPYINLHKGAEILLEQYERTNDWWLAVGRYHAPAQTTHAIKRAKRYSKRVKKHWLRIAQSNKEKTYGNYQ